jgi:hypothetical protein
VPEQCAVGFSAIGGQAMSKRRFPVRSGAALHRAHVSSNGLSTRILLSPCDTAGNECFRSAFIGTMNPLGRESRFRTRSTSVRGRANILNDLAISCVESHANSNIDTPSHETLWKSQRHECNAQRRNGGDSAACKDLVRRLTGCACADPASRTCPHPNTGEFRAQVEISSCGDSRGRSAE